MTKAKSTNTRLIANANSIRNIIEYNSDEEAALRYLRGSYLSYLEQELYNPAYANCTAREFLLAALTKGQRDLTEDKSASFGKHYKLGDSRILEHNQATMFSAINALPEPARETIFRNALHPGTLLNTFFRQGEGKMIACGAPYINRVENEVHKIHNARDLLAGLLGAQPMQRQMIESLAKIRNNKEVLLEYIRRHPIQQDRDALVRAALDVNTNLHRFFAVQRGFFATSAKAGTLKILNEMNPDPETEKSTARSSCFRC